MARIASIVNLMLKIMFDIAVLPGQWLALCWFALEIGELGSIDCTMAI
jgi:hypothetical protein